MPDGVPTFRSDVNAVSVEVAVLDNKGRFIPGIPRGNFRVLEDGVPQQISNFGLGEAPMTVCLVIEFSNLFQSYWTESWYQTLTAAYGFLETLRPEDYVAVVAYDLRPEILSDFSTDKRAAYEAMRRLQIRGLFGVEPVRRGDRHRRAHEGHRRPQGHRADLLRRGHLQQDHLRQNP